MNVAAPPERRILVVDDEPLVCEAVRMMLLLDGHEVVTANNGADAIAAFEQGEFDLVITDYSMPEMKGDELASAIKARKPGQPVLMLTAYAEMLRKGAGSPFECIDCLMSKPFDLAKLREAISMLAGRD